jgi:putative aldouronate transport system permease protein
MTLATAKAINPVNLYKKKITPQLLFRQRTLILMSFPFLAWLIVFSYYPIWGWLMAFQNFKPHLGIFESTWVGLDHFQRLMNDNLFKEAFRNTIGQSFFQLLIGFPIPIIFALLLNEIKFLRFKKTTQTISYLPYFLSWVIACSMIAEFLSSNGIVNTLLMNLGIIEQPIIFLSKPDNFWWIVGWSTIWKNVGWNTIIYLAAITSIDPELYESAELDGAGRFARMWYITLPCIKATILVLLIMNIGFILNAGYEVQYLLGNTLTWETAETIDVFVMRFGIGMGNYSLATALGMFKTVVSIVLITIANNASKRFAKESLV